MAEFRADDYGPTLAELLRETRLAPLGPGTPNQAARVRFAALDVASAFAPHQVRDEESARACLAGLWLYHDFLDESHTISQDIDTATGSYWHGLLHRREPDYANAAYWFRRVGKHAVFASLTTDAARIAAAIPNVPGAAGFLTAQSSWDPFAFIDLCEAMADEKGTGTRLCREVQQREWEILFDFSHRKAVGMEVYSP